MSEPRVLTVDECRKRLLDYLDALVRHALPEDRQKTVEDKMRLLVFSILVAIDGGTMLPGFTLAPAPHPDDAEYNRERGKNWWPAGEDIAGELHSQWAREYPSRLSEAPAAVTYGSEMNAFLAAKRAYEAEAAAQAQNSPAAAVKETMQEAAEILDRLVSDRAKNAFGEGELVQRTAHALEATDRWADAVTRLSAATTRLQELERNYTRVGTELAEAIVSSLPNGPPARP